MNWKTKVAIQFVLAHMPYGEQANHVLQRVSNRYTPERLKKRIADTKAVLDYIEKHTPLSGATIVEVGTGWELIAPLMMAARGAGIIHTYDLNRHVRVALARQVAEMIPVNFDDAMHRINYHAPADAAETGLLEKSV